MDHNTELDALLLQPPTEILSLLCHPGLVRLGGAARQQDAAGGQVDIDKDIEALEEDRVDGKEVGRHERLGVSGQESLPAQLCSAPCRRDPGRDQYGADRGRGRRIPDLEQFTTNPKISPILDFPWPDDQSAALRGDWGLPRRGRPR
jgi:hypothetical protein